MNGFAGALAVSLLCCGSASLQAEATALNAHQKSALKARGIPDASLLNEKTAALLAEHLPTAPGEPYSPASAGWLKLGLPSIRKAVDKFDKWSADPAAFKALPAAERKEEAAFLAEYLNAESLGGLGIDAPKPKAESPRSEDARPVKPETRLPSKTVPAPAVNAVPKDGRDGGPAGQGAAPAAEAAPPKPAEQSWLNRFWELYKNW